MVPREVTTYPNRFGSVIEVQVLAAFSFSKDSHFHILIFILKIEGSTSYPANCLIIQSLKVS
jgi:hypothetical protein